MANYFSNVLAGADNTTYKGALPSSTVSAVSHARTRTTLASLDATLTTSDVAYLAILKPTDRLIEIQFSCDGNPTAGAFNLGVSVVSQANNDLGVVESDADLFASARVIATAEPYTDKVSLFNESGTLDDIMDRGKPMWELANAGSLSYADADAPGGNFAITVTPTITFDAAAEISFEIIYAAGD